MKKLIRLIIAIMRFNKRIVCEESTGQGPYDFHDYSDSIEGRPWHFVKLTCKRCGKKFII